MLKPEAAPHIIRVFVASPADVAPEREILARVIVEMNDTLKTFELPLQMELVRWETHSAPAPGDTQTAINEQIGDFEIFIGIMWTRFGTRTQNAGSGTEEEYDRAYKLWKKRGEPYIMFYFSKASAPPPDSPEDAEQLVRVSEFRKRIIKQQYCAFYKGRRDFEAKIRQHLLLVLKRYWNIIRAAERKQNEVIDEGRREIRDAVNTLPAVTAARAPNPEPERLSPEEVSALRALLIRAYETTTPPAASPPQQTSIPASAPPSEGADKKGDDDETGWPGQAQTTEPVT